MDQPMPWKLWIRLAELLVTAILALSLFAAWRAERRDRTQLAAELATAKQTLAQADSRQHDRDAQLLQTLSSLAAEKRTVTSPAQIIRDLPQQMGLPTPIALQTSPGQASSDSPGAKSGAPKPNPMNPSQDSSRSPGQQAVIPAADLKPLYDFALDCKACQAKLAAAQADLTDEKAKAITLTNERDTAVRAAKGGSALRRIARAAKWFAIGAAAGAIASRAAH
jgi:hypothetical protein